MASRSTPSPSSAPIDVLLVDDNLSFAAILARLLERSGLSTQVEPSALHAYRVLERCVVHVIVTDQHMPGPLGTKLLESAAARWPRCRRVIMSANTDSQLVADAITAHRVIEKSLPLQSILQIICEERTRAQGS